MKTIDLEKLETALVCALSKFWRDRPPLFSLSKNLTGSDGNSVIEIVLHGRTEPIDVLRIAESEFDDRTAPAVLRCADKMAYAWMKWTRAQLGDHDIKSVLSRIPYENIAANFPLIKHDGADIFVDGVSR